MAGKPDPFWQELWTAAFALAAKGSQAGTYMHTRLYRGRLITYFVPARGKGVCSCFCCCSLYKSAHKLTGAVKAYTTRDRLILCQVYRLNYAAKFALETGSVQGINYLLTTCASLLHTNGIVNKLGTLVGNVGVSLTCTFFSPLPSC